VVRTDNGSEAAGAALDLSFGDGRRGLKLAYGQADVSYVLDVLSSIDFGTLDIRQSGEIANAELSYGLTDTISVGLDASWLKTTVTEQRLTDLLPPILGDFGVEVEQLTYGPVLEWDTVDDTIYPSSGQRLRYVARKGEGLNGFDADFWRQTVSLDAYAPFGERIVLAGKALACRVDGDAPFFSLCGVGVTDGLRGYAAGLFFDNALASVQSELRVRATGRIGMTLFGGASSIAPTFEEMDGDDILAAGGVGLRYRLSQKFPLDFSVDGAWNADGEFSTYVYVGQNF
jgi:outer membrane protein assembly factor BamA